MWEADADLHAQDVAVETDGSFEITDADVIFKDPFNRGNAAVRRAAYYGLVARYPFAPSHYAQLWLRRIQQHGNVFKKISIGVIEDYGRCRHPSKNNGLVCGLSSRVARSASSLRGDTRRSQPLRCY